MRSRHYAINIDIPSNIPFEEHPVKSRLGDIYQAPPLYPLAPEMEDDGSLLQIGAIPSFQRPFKGQAPVDCQNGFHLLAANGKLLNNSSAGNLKYFIFIIYIMTLITHNEVDT